jgi:hypothetical protein
VERLARETLKEVYWRERMRKDGIGAEFNWANVEKSSIRFREERVWLGDERIRLGQKKRV